MHGIKFSFFFEEINEVVKAICNMDKEAAITVEYLVPFFVVQFHIKN
jgi:hypothetical protein